MATAGPLPGRRRRIVAAGLGEHVAVRRGLPLVVIRLDVVLAHGMPGEGIPHQDAPQIRMPLEDDTVEIEDLALLELATAPDRREGRQRDRVGAVAGAGAQDHRTMTPGDGVKVVDDLKMARRDARLLALGDDWRATGGARL
jgi:hypothetical protein